MQYLMMVRWWLTISATFWLIRMMSMSSRRMKLLRVSWDGDIRMGGDTSSNPSAARLVPYLNVWDGSVLVHHHKVWPPVVYLILICTTLSNSGINVMFRELTCFCQAHRCPQEGSQHMCPEKNGLEDVLWKPTNIILRSLPHPQSPQSTFL